MPKLTAKNILIITEYYPPHWTGLAQSIFYAAHNLASRGHTVHVLTTHSDPHALKHEVGVVTVTRVPYQFQISRTDYSFSILKDFIRLLPTYNTVIINSPNSNILFLALFAKIFRKKLIIYHQADILLPRHTGNRIKHRFIELLFDFFTIPSMVLADTVSSFTYDYAEFSRVMRYSLPKFAPYIPDIQLSAEPPQHSFKKQMDTIKKAHKLIGISGRFVEEKGFDLLFQALPDILKKIPSAHIVFAGQHVAYEPFYDRHRALFESQKKHVTFLGMLTGADLSYFYECLDVFVLSSRIECFALTQIEASQKRVPIVVTNVPGARMLVLETEFGEIATHDNLAEKIIAVLKNTQKYQKNYKKVRPFLEKFHNFPLQRIT